MQDEHRFAAEPNKNPRQRKAWRGGGIAGAPQAGMGINMGAWLVLAPVVGFHLGADLLA